MKPADTLTCVKAATDAVGDKWTPQLLRYFLLHTSLRFCQLQEYATGINPRTLSARLLELENKGLIEKVPSLSSRCEYRITDKGKSLQPIIEAMGVWSKAHK